MQMLAGCVPGLNGAKGGSRRAGKRIWCCKRRDTSTIWYSPPKQVARQAAGASKLASDLVTHQAARVVPTKFRRREQLSVILLSSKRGCWQPGERVRFLLLLQPPTVGPTEPPQASYGLGRKHRLAQSRQRRQRSQAARLRSERRQRRAAARAAHPTSRHSRPAAQRPRRCRHVCAPQPAQLLLAAAAAAAADLAQAAERSAAAARRVHRSDGGPGLLPLAL